MELPAATGRDADDGGPAEEVARGAGDGGVEAPAVVAVADGAEVAVVLEDGVDALDLVAVASLLTGLVVARVVVGDWEDEREFHVE